MSNLMAMAGISVIVHTRNEEENISACMDSCLGWASEVIVADMGSTDRTCILAKDRGATLLSLEYDREFDRARNLSAEVARNDWILFLDADEILTNEVRGTIEECIKDAAAEVAAFSIPFRVHSFGASIEHAGGWWPSYKSPPLLRKGHFTFPGGIHQPAIVDGRIIVIEPKSLDDAIQHYSHRSVSHYVDKLNRYTDLEADDLVCRGVKTSWHRSAAEFSSAFRSFYDPNGHKDGTSGFLLSVGSALYELITQLKVLERQGAVDVPRHASEFLDALSSSDAGEPAVPSWLQKLVNLLSDGPNIFSDIPSLMQKVDESYDAVVLRRIPQAKIEARLRDRMQPGSLIALRSELPVDQMALFGQTCWHRLVTPEDGCWWFAWTDGVASDFSIDLLCHRDALNIFGGGEVQVFETLRALRGLRVCGGVWVGVQPKASSLQHVFSTHVPLPTASPYLLTPIYWNRSELARVVHSLRGAYSYCTTSEEIESALCVSGPLASGTADPHLGEEAKELVLGASLITSNADCEFLALFQQCGADSAKHVVVPNAVRTRQSEAETFRRLLDCPPYLLCVGRLEWNKNQLVLLTAIRDEELHCVLIGDEFDREYSDLCRRAAGANVHFLGRQNQDVIWSAYQSAAAHCLPSFGETPGLANLEAASVGCPIVVSNRGAEREYFGDLAWYCDPLDPQSIRTAVRAAVASGRGGEMTKRLRDLVTKEYSWTNVASKLRSVYEGILHG